MSQQALTLLLIEDDKQCARMIEKVLPQHGYTVHHAPTGLLGLQMARKINPQVILVDMGLPDLDGKVVVNQLRGFTSNQMPAIIAFTAEGGARAKRLALAFGCDGFISKPIDTHELHDQITNILQIANTEGNKP